METQKIPLFCDTEYTSNYSGSYGDNVVFYDEELEDDFDEDIEESDILDADLEESVVIEDLVDYHDRPVNQPSHPYNGDIMPVA